MIVPAPGETMSRPTRSDLVIAGSGLAGIVTALDALRSGLSVTLVDRDEKANFGGLARWAFGGMALVGTPLQRRMKIPDTPEIALADWLRFGELGEDAHWPRAWAKHYVERSRPDVHDWLREFGLKFLPAVNWVERGRFGDGNRLPRYHVLWGTSLAMTEALIAALHEADHDRLTCLHQHRVTRLETTNGRASGLWAVNEAAGDEEVLLLGENVVLAMGGLNASPEECRANWPDDRPMPAHWWNGSHPYADGKLHHWVADNLGGQITHAGEMWNYAAGFPHPQPRYKDHGLSCIPCKSALWLDHTGRRIGPEPLVTAFDTHWLCQRVAEQEKHWTWQLLNRRIALKEFAISGAEHNKNIREKNFPAFVRDLLFGNRALVEQMQRESDHFLTADTLPALAAKMNALTGEHHVDPAVLQATVDAFDANFVKGADLENDMQLRLIRHARQWRADKLRTCKPAPLQKSGSGPFIAIRMELVTRKSLGGLQTDLGSRVLAATGDPVPGLYCVGEAAGFGGGGASGKRSLEGTFLPGCILTAHAAARTIAAGG